VPTYEYQCEKCQRVFEVRQRITEPALTTCEVCGGHIKRLLFPAPFILKGEGWYVTDYPSEARKKAKEAEKPATDKGSDKGSADKGAADKPAASKSDASPSSGSSSTSSGPTGAASPSAPAKSD